MDRDQLHAISTWATVVLAMLTLILAVVAICTLVSNQVATKRSERAYLFVSPGNVYNVTAEGSPMQAYFNIGNSGKTFAQIAEWRFGVNLFEGELPNQMEDLGTLSGEPGRPVIWPGLPHPAFRTFRTLDANEIQKLRNNSGDKRIYVFGVIRYTDVFGESHRTAFCHEYFGAEHFEFPEHGGPGYHQSQVKYCDKFNEAE